MNGEIKKCQKCGAKCCQEMFFWLEKWQDAKDWRRWAKFHENVEVGIKDGGFFVKVKVKCRKLKNDRCSIYKKRPQLCREYDCRKKEFIFSK